MRIQHLVSLGVYASSKDVPQLENSFCYDFNCISGISSNQKTAVMSQYLILDLRQDVFHNIPIVIGVNHC